MTDPAPDPATLTIESFRPLVGEPFALRPGPDAELELTLTDVRSLGESGGTRREPFALSLRGPADPQLPQATYAVAHPALGEHAIFLVPVARSEADGTDYEAIFT